MSDILDDEGLVKNIRSKNLEIQTEGSDKFPLWPSGRGVYLNEDGGTTILFLINQEDHVKCIVSRNDCDIGECKIKFMVFLALVPLSFSIFQEKYMNHSSPSLKICKKN